MRPDTRRDDATAVFVVFSKARAFALKEYGTTAFKVFLSKASAITLDMDFHFNASLGGQRRSYFLLPIGAAH
jgi:hypothetical protein